MKISTALLLFVAPITIVIADDKKDEKITFDDHIMPIFENKCLNCHNPDEAKGGLDLSTYGAMLAGGSGGKVIEPEDPNGSRIYSLMAHKEEPYMPPRKPKAPDAELALIAKWINGGILETSSSKARKSDKPKMDMTLITSAGKPEGPAAMPEHVLLQPEVVTDRPNAVPALAHSPWAPIVAIAGQKQVILYHSEDYDVLGILPYPEGFPQSLSFSSSGALLQAGGGRGGKAGNVVAWDVKTGERVIEVGREFDIVLGSDISPDHRHVVMGGPGKIFKIWDTVTGEQVKAVKKHPDWMLTADYSPDGVLLATGGRNSGLYVWEGGTGLEFYTLKGHTQAVTNLGWRPDSNVLGSISEDGQVILWEMNEGKQIKKWNAHPGGGLAIDFSPDGQMIATAGRDKNVKIWKIDGAGIRTIKASDDIVMSVAFTHDNKRVISGDYNGVIKVWNVADGKELAELDANPPTIDKQIEYAEKQITELNSKIPQLEKSVAAVRADAQRARAKLAEVSKKAGELGGKKAAMEKELAALDGKIKVLAGQKTKVEGQVSQNRNLMQQRIAERIKAEQELAKAQKEAVDRKAALDAHAKNLQSAKAVVEALQKKANQPLFDDPNKEKAYRAALSSVNTTLAAKQAADALVAAKQKGVSELTAKLNAQKKALSELTALKNSATQTRDNAQKEYDATIAQLKTAEAKLAAAGANPAPELAQAQQKALKDRMQAQKALEDAKKSYANVYAKEKTYQSTVSQLENQLKVPIAELNSAKNDQKNKVAAYQKAESGLKPFIEAGSDRYKEIDKARMELQAKVAAYKKAEADFKNQQNLANQANSKLAQWQARVKSAKATEMSARGDMEESSAELAMTAKQLTETGSKLNQSKAEATKVAQALDALQKQKEAQAKAVSAIAAKEAEAKRQIETALANLEQTKFLAQKFKAAAINYEAKLESEELNDMTVELEEIREEETDAKEDFKVAANARVEAEKTLENAKKTVVVGNQKLKETTSTVLESALSLVASRAAVDLREEVVADVETETPEGDSAEVAILDTVLDVIKPEEPVEVIEEEEVVEVVSTTLAVKTPAEIEAEITAIEKRLAELTKSISQAYSEADKMKETVEKASDVAQKTPAVIAERTKIEQTKAQEAKAIEEERKAKEALVHKQKSLIDQLKKKYLESVPKRK